MQVAHLAQQMGKDEPERPIWEYLDTLDMRTSLDSALVFLC